ncbi:hypothetical protein B0T14DRAFT_567183 [Immersiella caudata]|uniref:DUF7779 domain-containing protein n=1 Tax=Immersiella caudata TaxID=314043 RepID=A0AA40C0U7_9PEZI|nr:hypothetical protein B0T14DRAFT_567183 [Immersiella caudata]
METRLSMSEFIHMYKEQPEAPDLDESRAASYDTGYQLSLGSVFAIAMAGLSMTALTLLKTLAFLSPDGVDRNTLLNGFASTFEAGVDRDTESSQLLSDIQKKTLGPWNMSALGELLPKSLVSGRPDPQGNVTKIVMHRIVQQVVMSSLRGHYETSASDEARAYFQRAVDIMGRCMPWTAAIKTSSLQNLQGMEWCLDHSLSLAQKIWSVTHGAEIGLGRSAP